MSITVENCKFVQDNNLDEDNLRLLEKLSKLVKANINSTDKLIDKLTNPNVTPMINIEPSTDSVTVDDGKIESEGLDEEGYRVAYKLLVIYDGLLEDYRGSDTNVYRQVIRSRMKAIDEELRNDYSMKIVVDEDGDLYLAEINDD